MMPRPSSIQDDANRQQHQNILLKKRCYKIILYQKITELGGHVKLKGVLQRMEDRFEILLAISGMSMVRKTKYLSTACLPFVIRHLIVIDELRPYLRNMQKMNPFFRTSLKTD
jgi:hypothetical protein